jgi:hypothetical protein
MSCDKLNGKIEARVTLKGKTTMRTKCTVRESHQYKPCKLAKSGECHTKIKTPPAKTPQMKKCADANTPRGKKTKGEHHSATLRSCKLATQQLAKTGVTCKVSMATGKCGNTVLAAKKRNLMLR